MQFQVVSAAEASQVGGRPSVPPVILWLPRGGRAAQEMRGSGKAIALKKNPHRERHHAMYCNVMFI